MKKYLEKIMTIILEEVNGCTPKDAKVLAPENQGSELWNRIEKVLENGIERTYYFDCWKRDGVVDCKEIQATSKEHAILKFEKEFEDYGYDEPYN